MFNQQQLVALHLCNYNSKVKLSSDVLDSIINSEIVDPVTALHSVITRLRNKKNYSIEDAKSLLVSAQKQIELASAAGVTIVTYFDPAYPRRLKDAINNKAAPMPLVLFVKGNVQILNSEVSIAVVGTREASTKAMDMSKSFAKGLAEHGTCIVSGLAQGCDTAAHNGALSIRTGKTIAVMGHGLHMITPKCNISLAKSIIDEAGCLLSIYPLGTAPKAEYFPARNAMQVALSDATCVIQAQEKSGTMTTAGHSLAQGVPLFCVDPAYDTPAEYAGNAALLREHGINTVRTFDPYNIQSFCQMLNDIRRASMLVKPAGLRQSTLNDFVRKRSASALAKNKTDDSVEDVLNKRRCNR